MRLFRRRMSWMQIRQNIMMSVLGLCFSFFVHAQVLPTALGYGFSCVLDDAGLKCWGNPDAYQAMPTLQNPKMLAAGAWHTCVVDDNALHCWGHSIDGNLMPPPRGIVFGENRL